MSEYTLDVCEDEIVVKGKIDFRELIELSKIYAKKGYREVNLETGSVIRFCKAKERYGQTDQED